MTGKDLLSLSFRVIGLLFAVIGAVAAASTAIYITRAVSVPGVVVDHVVEQNAISLMSAAEPTGLLYYPVVAYDAPSGESHTLTGRSGRTRKVYEAGDSLPVLVSPDDPQDARIDSTFGVWGSSIILGALGALFLLLSVLAPQGFGGSKSRG